jgi:hypothetical protein
MFVTRLTLLAVLFSAAVLGLSAQDDDPVQSRLKIARTAYKVEFDRYRAAVAAYFEKREDAARSAGNKTLVDQIKSERTAFQDQGDLPSTAPLELRRTINAARLAFMSALQDAIKDYTKAKKDNLAAAVEKELTEFKFEDAPWVSLFNGKDLKGWHNSQGSKAKWEVRRGLLSATGGKGFLMTDRSDFMNFRVRIEMMIELDGDSGLLFRVPDSESLKGYEIQLSLLPASKLKVGSLASRDPKFKPVEATGTNPKPNQWFILELRVDGNNVTVWIDSKQILDLNDRPLAHKSGAISLQKPMNEPNPKVHFRRIEIKELPAK